MIFQRFLKGVRDSGSLDTAWAKAVLDREGLSSAWLRSVRAGGDPSLPGDSDPEHWTEFITEEALRWHITRFEDVGYGGSQRPFRELSPFISVTAGTVEPDHRKAQNNGFPAWLTAFAFATDWGAEPGWVFYGYVSVLGRPSLPLLEFAEEARDLHQYDWYNPYHREGEVLAKIWVPPVRLEGAVRLDVRFLPWPLLVFATPLGQDPLRSLGTFVAGQTYRPPSDFANLRDAL